MLGSVAALHSGHCPCNSCRVVHQLALETLLRRWQRSTQAGLRPPWDEDLSDVDLETLARAGWTAAEVQAHVETLQKMVEVLAQSYLPFARAQCAPTVQDES